MKITIEDVLELFNLMDYTDIEDQGFKRCPVCEREDPPIKLRAVEDIAHNLNFIIASKNQQKK